jgi:cell division protein FtsB
VELDKAKAASSANTEGLQSLAVKQHETAQLLSESRRAVSALTLERDQLAAEIAELSDEKKGECRPSWYEDSC